MQHHYVMKHFHRLSTHFALLVIVVLMQGCDPNGAAAPHADPAPEPRTDGEWIILFDGHDLDQWRGFKGNDVPPGWIIEDGTLHFTGGNGGDIITRSQFDDFELTLEWKISERGNSGIFFHVVEDGRREVWHSGPEYQLLDDLSIPGLNPAQYTAADYDLYAPDDPPVRPAGEWNETRIVVDQGRVEYYLNGQRTVQYEIGSDDWNARVAASKFAEFDNWGLAGRGHIALQDHGDPVWFRNIRIRVLN